jgi:hypothetical protein
MFYACDTETKQSSVVYDADELATAVTDTIHYYKEQYQRIAKENRKLKDNAYAVVYEQFQNEMDSLREQLRLSYGSFSSQKEKDRYIQFEKRHMHNRTESKANGGRAPYLIPTGAGIGTILKVVCPICGESEDITDTEVW